MGAKLLKANIEKMSTFRLSIILMKAKKLRAPFHHVDENKQERRLRRGQ
jgi:hypothetical protein